MNRSGLAVLSEFSVEIKHLFLSPLVELNQGLKELVVDKKFHQSIIALWFEPP